jgi:hypothetical protein
MNEGMELQDTAVFPHYFLEVKMTLHALLMYMLFRQILALNYIGHLLATRLQWRESGTSVIIYTV